MNEMKNRTQPTFTQYLVPRGKLSPVAGFREEAHVDTMQKV